jgi:two-component system, response regulator PdtaR
MRVSCAKSDGTREVRIGTEAHRHLRTVLVVDDEIFSRLMMADELRHQGYGVIEAANADEALAVVDSGTEVDVIVTDVQMPGAMDGIGLAASVRKNWPLLKVIVLSGTTSSAEKAASLADAFFAKPCDLPTLLACIATLAGPNNA